MIATSAALTFSGYARAATMRAAAGDSGSAYMTKF